MQHIFKTAITSSCLIFFGCITWTGALTASEPVVTVVDNVFSSNKLPKLQLIINDDFEYIGHTSEDNEGRNMDPGGDKYATAKSSVNSYTFLNKNTGGSGIKVFSITILKMLKPNWYFFEDVHERLPEILYAERGHYKFGNDNYKSAVFVGNLFTDQQKQLLRKQNVTVPRLFTIKEFEKNVAMNGSVKVCITYAEDLGSLNNNDNPISMKTDAERAALAGFLNSFEDVLRPSDSIKIKP
jgi:hypothetical protein